MSEDKWLLRDKDIFITSIDEICKAYDIKDKFSIYGFIYELVLVEKETNTIKYYIGKKNFYSINTMLSKRDKLPRPGHIQFKRKRKNHKLVEYEIVKKESDWLTYTGSFEHKESYDVFGKYILDICQTKRMLTYLEAKALFCRNAIIDEKYINANILNKFFRGNIIEPDDEIDYTNLDLATNGGVYQPICSS